MSTRNMPNRVGKAEDGDSKAKCNGEDTGDILSRTRATSEFCAWVG